MGIVIARLLRRKLYAWCNAYRKKVMLRLGTMTLGIWIMK